MKDNRNTKGRSHFTDDLVTIIYELGKSILIIAVAGFIVTKKNLNDRPDLFSRLSSSKKILICAVSTCLGIGILYLVRTITGIDVMYRIVIGLFGFWVLGFGIAFAFHFLFSTDKDKNRITTKNLKSQTSDFDHLIPFLNDPLNIPVGLSMKTNKPVILPINNIREHSLTSGATGQGKTTLLKTKVYHFIKHNRPVIIIDPKGEKADVELIRSIAASFGREKDFKLFSLSFPNESCSYNPIKVGSPLQQKDKLLSGLELSHEYYGSKADEFLGAIFDACHYLGRPLDLSALHQILINKNEFSNLTKSLHEFPESDVTLKLINQMSSVRQINDKDLSGLIAQIGSLNSLELMSLLTKKTSKPELDLVDVLQNNQIAYFQLNVNAYQKIAKKLGKLIVQDLRLVSNLFQSELISKNFDIAICFIDEFGSFATKDFADFLKMARSSGIGCDLSFQGIADLKSVSPSFSEQIIGNTVFKMVLRQDVNDDVETWSAMAGTEDYEIESKQTQEDLIFGSRETGMGNSHTGKRVLIDFDVFKKLGRGQAVFIDKSRHLNDLVSIWNINPAKLAQKNSESVQKNNESSEKFERSQNNFSEIKIRKLVLSSSKFEKTN